MSGKEDPKKAVMDWLECPIVKVKPDIQGSRPAIKGTRMPTDDIVENCEDGLDESEIATHFQLPVEQVRALFPTQQSIKILRILFDKNVPYPLKASAPFGRGSVPAAAPGAVQGPTRAGASRRC